MCMSQQQKRDRSRPGTVVVTLPDEMDYGNSQGVSDQLIGALRPGITTVIADMTHTAFCDSAGLASIAMARRISADRGISLLIAASAGIIKKLFEVTGLDTVLPVYPTVDAALSGDEPA